MNAGKDKIINFLQNVKGKAILGIDGIIDEVWYVVDTRTGATTFEPMQHMKHFGELIVERGSGGLAKELVKKRRTCGGFTANTGRALTRLGIDTTMIGTYGSGQFDPAFDEFVGTKRFSLGAPAVCSILEFTDGKIMMPQLENLLQLDWAQLKSMLDIIENGKVFEGADIIGLGYWSNMPDFDNILTGLVNEYLTTGSPKRLFFDFANITKKTVQALKQTLTVMKALNEKIPMTLSLNEHEGALFFEYFDIKENAGDNVYAISALSDKIGIDEIVIHTPHFAAIATAHEGNLYAEQTFVEKPVRTAGAGDSFNGGYIASCLGGLGLCERLAVANAVTNFYVSQGYPPDGEQLVSYLTTH